jgi:Core-2/I-Branching enzyme
MKIAYIILAHRLPDQLIRMIHQLEDSDVSFFIHVDKKSDKKLGNQISHELQKQLGARANVHLVKKHVCYWGAFGIIQGTAQGIKELVESGIEFDRVVLLSGQDYPIKSTDHIKTFFQENHGKEFMQSFVLTSRNPWSDHGGSYRDVARVLHWHFNLRSKHVRIPIRRKFFKGMEPYGGSQWWCLSRECIQYIYHFLADHPRFLTYFKHTFIPDELFFQTIVSNSSFGEKITGENLTYADWDNPNPQYPAVLGKNYFDQLATSPKLFARKFDTNRDTEILDLIDQRILNPLMCDRLDQPSLPEISKTISKN